MFEKINSTELVRLESEFYTAKSFDLINPFSGEEIIDFVQYGTSKELNEKNEGYPILRLNEFDSSFISEPSKYCKVIDEDTFQSLKLQQNDVLICRTNGNYRYVGKSAIVPMDYEFAYASYLFKIRPKKELINSSTLVSFLNSKYGRIEIEKYSMASNQVNFSPAKFRQLRIPRFGKGLNNEIEKLTYESFENLQQSKQSYNQAENLLLEEIGLLEFSPSKKAVNIKSFKNSFATSGRLDAEYYQPKYEDYENLILQQQYTFIKDEYIHIKTKSKKDKIAYNYIEIGNVNVSDGSNKSNYVLTKDLPANAKTLVKKGDILISNVRPYRGAVTIVNSDKENVIVSGAFTVLRRDENSIFNNEVLKVLLRSSVYKDWLLKFNVGTSYPVIKDADVLNLPIPFIKEEKQNQIAELIEQSFTLKKQSEHLLDVAQKAVEITIERNEDLAMEYINQNSISNG